MLKKLLLCAVTLLLPACALNVDDSDLSTEELTNEEEQADTGYGGGNKSSNTNYQSCGFELIDVCTPSGYCERVLIPLQCSYLDIYMGMPDPTKGISENPKLPENPINQIHNMEESQTNK